MNKTNNKTIDFIEEARSENTPSERLKELAATNDELAEIVASNVAAPPELLEELTSHKSKAVRKAVISNPNTPTEALLKLGEYFPHDLLKNPVFELLFLENPDFCQKIPRNLLVRLLQQENVPNFLLDYAKKNNKKISFHNLKIEKALIEILEMHVNSAEKMTEGWHEVANNVIQQFSHYPNYDFDYNYEFIQKYNFDFLSNFWEFMPTRISSLIQHKRAMAKNPRTPPKILEQLAFNKDRWIQKILERNKNIFASTSDKFYDSTCESIMKHRHIAQHTLIYVAKHENTSIEILEQLATYRDSMVCMAVMENENTPIDVSKNISRQFATHEDINIRQIIAKNENTPIEVLERLKTDDNFKVRARVAQNQKSPVSILKLLANDKDSRVRAEVVNNENTPNDLLKQLICDRDCWVIKAFIYNYKIPSIILEEFIVSPDINTRKLIAQNLNLPLNILEKLATDSYISVRTTLAENSNLPVKIVEQLAIDSNAMLRVSLAENPNLPVKIVEQLATDSFIYVRKTLAKNPNLPVKILEKLVLDLDSDVRKNLASNLCVSVSILKMLATDRDSSVCHSVVENSKCTFEIKETIFKNFAQSEKPSYCRLILFLSDYAESSVLAEHGNSISWLERYAIAQNPKTPKDTLKQLAHDGNRIVRATAKESLQKYHQPRDGDR